MHSIGLTSRDTQRLVKVRHKEIVPPFQLLYVEWIEENVRFKDIGVLAEVLISRKLVCITNKSFYLDKLDLISATWVASVNKGVVVEGDFIL